MVVVFGSFLLSSILLMKELGFALAAAVLIDATIVRIVLVPATMRLLGEWNWWLPKWLDRILPRVSLERDTRDLNEEPKRASVSVT
jgi:RND superfamily putative drug exporter